MGHRDAGELGWTRGQGPPMQTHSERQLKKNHGPTWESPNIQQSGFVRNWFHVCSWSEQEGEREGRGRERRSPMDIFGEGF